MRIPILVALLLSNATALADPKTDAQIKDSFLTLSAFECAVVSPNDKETERLFILGLNAGREFIAYAQSHKDSYLKDLRPKVAILWNMTSGPSPDFILGQIYANRADEIYKEYSPDEGLWKMKKQNMYHSKNCALLGK